MTRDLRPKAVVYISDPTDAEAAVRCVAYVQSLGYRFVGIVQSWEALERMLEDGTASYAIVDRRDEIPLDPRVKIVAEQARQNERSGPAAASRTSRLNRRSAEA